MAKLNECRRCGRQLQDGPDQVRSANSANFTVTIEGIPTRACPAGCVGFYWYWADLGVEVIEMLHQREHFSRLKGVFRRSHVCRSCGAELRHAGAHRDFAFQTTCRKGTAIEMTVSGPALLCTRCNEAFIPAARGEADELQRELVDLIGKALTHELYYE